MPSDLPILPSDPPAPPPRTTAEKYGALFQLGIAGLIVLVGLLTWFGLGVWSLRDFFHNIYVLHDPERNEATRVQAAYALSRDPKVTQRQYWDIALRTDLPPLARYLMAESLNAEAVAPDPRGYAIAVRRSPGWPSWLRLLIARPMAYAADDGYRLPPEELAAILRDTDDPQLRLWVAFTIAALEGAETKSLAPEARSALTAASEGEGPASQLARMLLDALQRSGPRRNAVLDEATRWMRRNHPESSTLWEGWVLKDDTLIRQVPPT